MAEFGAARCTFQGCAQHDFLPFVCGACQGTFCLAHRAFVDHECANAEAYLSVDRVSR
ncbi:unnamed protein product, partial [Phaeothamnion confervicola]